MLALWSGAPLTVGDIGPRLRLDTGTLTPLLKRLERAGLVERRRDPADERRVIIKPTADGWALREQVTEVPCELGRSLRLSQEEAASCTSWSTRSSVTWTRRPRRPGDGLGAPAPGPRL